MKKAELEELYHEQFMRIKDLEEELSVWKRPIVCNWCKEVPDAGTYAVHWKTCEKTPATIAYRKLEAENEALKRRLESIKCGECKETLLVCNCDVRLDDPSRMTNQAV